MVNISEAWKFRARALEARCKQWYVGSIASRNLNGKPDWNAERPWHCKLMFQVGQEYKKTWVSSSSSPEINQKSWADCFICRRLGFEVLWSFNNDQHPSVGSWKLIDSFLNQLLAVLTCYSWYNAPVLVLTLRLKQTIRLWPLSLVPDKR